MIFFSIGLEEESMTYSDASFSIIHSFPFFFNSIGLVSDVSTTLLTIPANILEKSSPRESSISIITFFGFLFVTTDLVTFFFFGCG